MRDPLILASRRRCRGNPAGTLAFVFHREAAWPIAAFLTLAILRACPSPLARRLHPSGAGVRRDTGSRAAPAAPPPEIDAGFRETVLLDGCVVEPTVFSPGREHSPWSSALESPRAREPAAGRRSGRRRSKLATDSASKSKPASAARTITTTPAASITRYLARQNIFWTATMAPRLASASVFPDAAARDSWVSSMRCADRRARKARPALRRRHLHHRNDGGDSDRRIVQPGPRVDRKFSPHRDLSCSGDFRRPCHRARRSAAVPAALVRVPELAALAMTAAAAWLYALVSGLSAPVVRAAGGFSLFLIARFLFRRDPRHESAGRGRAGLPDVGSRRAFDASFQLSFLSVAAIGALAAPLLEPRIAPLPGHARLNDVDRDAHLDPRVAQARVEIAPGRRNAGDVVAPPAALGRRAVALIARLALFALEMAMISTVIQIGLALPMAEYFHRVSFTGLTANLLICPLLEAVVPLGFAAIFTGFGMDGGARGLAAAHLRAHRGMARRAGAVLARARPAPMAGRGARDLAARSGAGRRARELVASCRAGDRAGLFVLAGLASLAAAGAARISWS